MTSSDGVVQQAFQKARMRRVASLVTLVAVLGQGPLNPLPEFQIDDGIVLARIAPVSVYDLSPIDPVREQPIEGGPGHGLTARLYAVTIDTKLANDAPAIEILLQRADGVEVGVAVEDLPDGLRFPLD